MTMTNLTSKEVHAAGGIYEKAKAGDKAAIAQWNDWCASERIRLNAKKAPGMFAVPTLYRQLWGG